MTDPQRKLFPRGKRSLICSLSTEMSVRDSGCFTTPVVWTKFLCRFLVYQRLLGATTRKHEAVKTWTDVRKNPSHDLVVNDQGLRVLRASHDEAYGQGALYISFGFSRPTLGVYDMHLNTVERRLLTPSQPQHLLGCRSLGTC